MQSSFCGFGISRTNEAQSGMRWWRGPSMHLHFWRSRCNLHPSRLSTPVCLPRRSCTLLLHRRQPYAGPRTHNKLVMVTPNRLTGTAHQHSSCTRRAPSVAAAAAAANHGTQLGPPFARNSRDNLCHMQVSLDYVLRSSSALQHRRELQALRPSYSQPHARSLACPT